MEKQELVNSEGKAIHIEKTRPTVLLVEDTLTNLELLEEIFKKDYNLPVAQNGEAAWHLIQTYPNLFDAVLLDRMLPDIMGDEVLKRMKKSDALKHIPVIFQTAKVTDDDIQEGLELGANFYILKPYRRKQLIATVRTAIMEHQNHKRITKEMEEMANAMGALALLREGTFFFDFRTPKEVMNLSMLLANIYPDYKLKIRQGLDELCLNAVEHGIANIGYDKKSELQLAGKLHQERERRLELKENSKKFASLHVKVVQKDQKIDFVQFHIQDPGNGFDHNKFRTIDPERIFDTHGRGIVMCVQSIFDEVIYNDKGNEVTAVIKFNKHEHRK